MADLGGAATYVAEVRRVLVASYDVEDKHFDGRPVVVGHRSDFRWRWGAVRLHTTVTVAAFDADVDFETLDGYLEAAGRAARAAAGGARGMQSGAAVVAIAVLPAMTQAARDWAVRPHGHRFASVGYPVAVGLTPPALAEPQRMRVGRLFRGFLRQVVRDVAAAPLEARPGPGPSRSD